MVTWLILCLVAVLSSVSSRQVVIGSGNQLQAYIPDQVADAASLECPFEVCGYSPSYGYSSTIDSTSTLMLSFTSEDVEAVVESNRRKWAAICAQCQVLKHESHLYLRVKRVDFKPDPEPEPCPVLPEPEPCVRLPCQVELQFQDSDQNIDNVASKLPSTSDVEQNEDRDTTSEFKLAEAVIGILFVFDLGIVLAIAMRHCTT
jgi:hypothetical protein